MTGTSASRPPLRVPLGLAALLWIAASAAAPDTARAHMPPTIYNSIAVDAEEVTWDVVMLAGLFDEWFGLEPHEAEDLDTAEWEAAKKRIETFFHEWGKVVIDGVPVRGVLLNLEVMSFVDHATTWEYGKLRFAFGTKGRPRTVALAWTNFDGGLGGFFDRIESEVDGFGETSYHVFREQEPEIVWHAPRRRSRSTVRRPPVVEGPPIVRVPMVSWGILGLLLLVVVPVLWRGRVGRGPSWALVGFGLALALGFAGVAHTEVTLPGGSSFQRPSMDDAQYTFETLLRNVYRAFDYDTEERIYDTLAETVQGELLEDIYLEVYGSLILQEEGGAVCKVQKVEVLQNDVTFPAEEYAPWYEVRSRWRVRGKVGHYGHTHIRVNEYDAVFRVALEGLIWKIASMRVLEKERVDDPDRETDR